MFNNQIAALLSEKPSSIISQQMLRFDPLSSSGDIVKEGSGNNDELEITEGSDPGDMGPQGSGETPWWIWLIIAILVVALFACLAIGMYRKKTGYYEKGEKASQQEQDVMTDDGLDEPFLTA